MFGEEHTWDSMSYPEFELCLRLPACGNKQTQVGMGIRQAQYRTPQCHRFVAEDRDGSDIWLLSSRSSRLHAVQTGSRTAGTVPDFIDRKGWDKAFEWCTKDEVAEPIRKTYYTGSTLLLMPCRNRKSARMTDAGAPVARVDMTAMTAVLLTTLSLVLMTTRLSRCVGSDDTIPQVHVLQNLLATRINDKNGSRGGCGAV